MGAQAFERRQRAVHMIEGMRRRGRHAQQHDPARHHRISDSGEENAFLFAHEANDVAGRFLVARFDIDRRNHRFRIAQIEAEISQLEAEERDAFLQDMGLGKSGADRLVYAAYELLDLITFYTLANDKLQSWQLPRGTTAPTAAGHIHSDMEAGFVRAEVTTADDIEEAEGHLSRLREVGRLRAEGRDYAICDGDVVTFLFKN